MKAHSISTVILSRRAALGSAAAVTVALAEMRVFARSATLTATPVTPSRLLTLPNNHQLFLACQGSGSPTVILEAGYRSPATVWSDDLVQPAAPRQMVFAGVATFTSVCLYERPGVASMVDGTVSPSRSAPVPMPRRVEDVVSDLHLLLATAGMPGPYVLVGHSLGGLMVQLYAATYPEQVAGLVLVDPFPYQLQDYLTAAEWTQFLAVNALFPAEMASYTDYEVIDFGEAAASMAAAPGLSAVPMIVIARNQPLGVSADVLGFDPTLLETAWRAAVEDVAAQIPTGQLIIAEQSSHYVQLEEPALVIEAIAHVVDAVRQRSVSTASLATPVP